MARRLPYAVARSRSAAPRPCGYPSLLEKSPPRAGEHRRSSPLRSDITSLSCNHLSSNFFVSFRIHLHISVEKIILGTNFGEFNWNVFSTESVGPRRTRERTLLTFLPPSFQSAAGNRRGVTCFRIVIVSTCN